MNSIDFDEEIIKHLQWRTMVEALLHNHEQAFVSPSVLIQDNKCQLGKWIYSDDTNQYASNQTFKKLLESHKEFHIKAGTILSLYQQGKIADAEELEDVFYQLSNEVIKCLESLKKQLIL